MPTEQGTGEFSGPELNSYDYPYDVSDREELLNSLTRRKEIPDGFVGEQYECEAIVKTNEWIVCSNAWFADYWPNYRHPGEASRLSFFLEWQLNHIELQNRREPRPLTAPSDARVWDYRYQEQSDKTKFNSAEYSLKAGQTFPAGDDPALVAQRSDWFKHGARYESVNSKQRIVLAGVFITTIASSGLLAFWLLKRRSASQ